MINSDSSSDSLFKKMASLHNIILELSTRKNLSDSADKILTILMENLEPTSGSIHLYSEDKLFLLSNRGKGCVNDDVPISNDEEKRLIISEMPVEIKDLFLYRNLTKFVEKGTFKFSLIMPMVSGEHLVGAIFLGNKKNKLGYTRNEKLFLAMLSKQIAIVVHNAYLEKELLNSKNLKTDLYIRSITDPLTGLYHRAHLETSLRESIKIASRYMRPFSALLIEIDYYFQISEMKGNQITYLLLQGVAKTIQNAIRNDVDLPARYSVDTIMVLLPETGSKGAQILAERIREKVNRLHEKIKNDDFPEVSVSIGVSSLEDKNEDHEDLIRKMKDGLEKAKSDGRNSVNLFLKRSDKQKSFTTFDAVTGMDSELIVSNIEEESNQKRSRNEYAMTANNAYKAVEDFRNNLDLDWVPEKLNKSDKKGKENGDQDYQPMSYLDIIDEEKEQKEVEKKVLKDDVKFPEPKKEIKATDNYYAIYKAKKAKQLKNKTDDLSVKKQTMKHGKVPYGKKSGYSKIHSLGFVDDI